MAKNEVLSVADDWVRLTDAPVERVTVQNRGSPEVEIAHAADVARKPRGLLLPRGTALVNRRLADLFPGAVTTTSHLYARTYPGGRGHVFISHV